MVFSSPEFLFAYLPVALLIYYITPRRARNLSLLIVSLIFYGWGEPVYVLLMAATIAADYGFGAWIGRSRGRSEARAALILACVFNLGILGFFKYYNFVAATLRPVLPFLPVLDVSLPIGISFYTFQALSYVIDVYRSETEYQRSPIAFGAYVSMFPQLIAGPIVKYRDVALRLEDRARSVTAAQASAGVRIFIAGLCKKVLLADSAGAIWDAAAAASGDGTATAAYAWFGIIMRTAQIYLDFSAYSDMAVGLGRLLGFEFMRNFNYPYISAGITEFWRRWHISLSSWFREYVYIPLGGNRRGRLIQYRNLLAVWLLTGLWHGDSWNFVLWGLYYFVLLAAEKAIGEEKLSKIPYILRNIMTMLLVIIGWVLFSFDAMSDVGGYFASLCGAGGLLTRADAYEIIRNLPFLLIVTAAGTPYPKRLYDKLAKRGGMRMLALDAVAALLFILCTAYIVSSSYHPFLYFRF